ncbi:alpha/beta fold hydrolase [Sphingomonas prati]|uniref:Pimeloyl-ACP methyl ester carboxylesterase n=1 Tax=Sphingomonas prati TaxID=1843237 RepID=A0A7W9F2U9_9SPHN|nr:alpha/beta hydrolase [Sphingomonas prati]MBB5730726.1 pimeloyl-ACP methyl ester carboxylesterase [Sphingomonas prati]
MTAWTDGYWWSKDGIRLHYRDYAGDAAKPPILCIPGLTRNARDFEGLAAALAPEWRVICVSLRGRADSGYARDPMSYVPLVYLQDLEALIETLGLERFVAVGTSLGGILTMLLAATGGGRIAGAVLNDIGPVLDPVGMARIKGYVGKNNSFPTWLHAARAIAETNGAAFPRFQIGDWVAMAKRLCRLTPAGRIVFDYDMSIAEPMRVPNEGALDMWPAFAALRSVPLLLVRGALSDLLSEETAGEMAARAPSLEVVTVPEVGHAPTLDEDEARAGIQRLLGRVLAAG